MEMGNRGSKINQSCSWKPLRGLHVDIRPVKQLYEMLEARLRPRRFHNMAFYDIGTAAQLLRQI